MCYNRIEAGGFYVSSDQAREFIEKLYNNEEIMKQVLILADATAKIKAGKKLSEEQQYQDLAEAASKMGYRATPEEYQKATKDYFEEIGTMESIGKVFQMIAVASDLVEQIM